MNRIVKYVNIVIAVVAIALLAGIYFFAWRPLPRTSGEIAAQISQKATASRDRLGVPHIRAATLEDALFVQGYVTAQDRLWQMDALRRYSAGELAEVIAPTLLESDKESRRLRLRRIAEQAYVQFPPEDRAAFAAYARGVNAYLYAHLDNLPVEFTLLQYQQSP